MPTTLILPYPPSVNKYWRHVIVKRRNATLISAEGRAYHAKVLEAARKQLGKNYAPIAGHVEFSAIIHPPSYMTRDLDNCLKAMLDAITKAKVWIDDSQAHVLHLAWGEVVAGGLAIVEIREMPPDCVRFVKREKPFSRRKKSKTSQEAV